MKNTYFVTLVLLMLTTALFAQTALEEAVDFHVKTIDGETIVLFDKLAEDKIVVIDFFTTSCGPCQTYAPDFQNCFVKFGENNANTFFTGINYNENNESVSLFDSIFGLTYPTVSGTQGGGNGVFEAYQVLSWPTVIVITPDHQVVEQYIWPPTEENITLAVENAGGINVGIAGLQASGNELQLFPNPSDGSFFIKREFNGTTSCSVSVVDLAGKELYRETAIAGAGMINIDAKQLLLKTGMYIVKLEEDAGRVYCQKLFIR
ncbi:MAG: redoxin domain-containing protein [Bacteroidetes bacterium]|nr:redoxin domain-containing protein [Bacteroidota bacterium]